MKLIGRLLLIILIGLLGLMGWIAYHTWQFSSIQQQVDPIAPIEISEAVVTHLSEALQFQTISNLDARLIDSSQFEGMKGFMADTYPLVDSLLEKKIFNDYGHLYKWQGSDPSLKPAILMGHIDVVPVPEENLPLWKQEPFSGKLADGDIWGRGAVDDKVNVIGLLEAAEYLLAKGFNPKRTLYFSFGHDEEVLGKLGAQAMVAYLKEQNVEPEFVLDEGYTLTKGLVPGVDGRVALIGIAEKGYCTIRISTSIKGGHSSMPSDETAIDVISTAIAKLNEHPFPERITYPMKAFMKNMGPEMPMLNRMAFGNYRIFEPLIMDIYSKTPAGAALVKTTMVPTIFHSGVKENVIPQVAKATFNFRLLPGDELESVMAHLKAYIDDERITYETVSYQPPSPVSSDQTWSYTQLDKTIKEVFPKTLTSPNLVIGATDGRFFYEICDRVYRFAPYHLTPETLGMFHGTNERIGQEDFKDAVRFYVRLMENVSEGDQ
ncbi:MAG: M20 family peptidase [Bacteroidota bacterium]